MVKRKLSASREEREENPRKKKKSNEKTFSEEESAKVWYGFECSHCPKDDIEDDNRVQDNEDNFNATGRSTKFLQRLVLCAEKTYQNKNKGLSL